MITPPRAGTADWQLVGQVVAALALVVTAVLVLGSDAADHVATDSDRVVTAPLR